MMVGILLGEGLIWDSLFSEEHDEFNWFNLKELENLKGLDQFVKEVLLKL